MNEEDGEIERYKDHEREKERERRLWRSRTTQKNTELTQTQEQHHQACAKQVFRAFFLSFHAFLFLQSHVFHADVCPVFLPSFLPFCRPPLFSLFFFIWGAGRGGLLSAQLKRCPYRRALITSENRSCTCSAIESASASNSDKLKFRDFN